MGCTSFSARRTYLANTGIGNAIPVNSYLARARGPPLQGDFMRRISLVFAMILLLTSASVLAQKNKIGPTLPPTPDLTWVCVQDDGGDGYFWLNLADGTYKCSMCEYG